jgi:dTMP kinase
VDVSIIDRLNDIVVPDLKPTVTFLLDLDVEEGLRRNRQAQKEDRFELETVEFHKRVRSGFLEIAGKDPDRVKIVDASKNPDEISNAIFGIIEGIWH